MEDQVEGIILGVHHKWLSDRWLGYWILRGGTLMNEISMV